MRLARTISACLIATLATLGGTASTANAAQGPAGELDCGSAGIFTVTGYGRGNALHLTTDSRTFVMTYLQNATTGEVIIDTPGQEGRRDILTCTTFSPVTERNLNVRGFLTPR